MNSVINADRVTDADVDAADRHWRKKRKDCLKKQGTQCQDGGRCMLGACPWVGRLIRQVLVREAPRRLH